MEALPLLVVFHSAVPAAEAWLGTEVFAPATSEAVLVAVPEDLQEEPFPSSAKASEGGPSVATSVEMLEVRCPF